MRREIWTLGEAWVSVWREVAGSKSGGVLLAAAYMRNLSLAERFDISRRGQPGSAYKKAVVEDVVTSFKVGLHYLSKADYDAVTNPAYQYRIEVSLVNPKYDGISQSNDLHQLHTCVIEGDSLDGSDDGPFEEEIAYNVEYAE